MKERKTTRKKTRNSKKKRRKTRGKRRVKASSKQRQNVWRRRILGAAGVLIAAVCVYTAVLDFRITRTFEGGHWDVPAQVYGRPMEIYPQFALTPGEFKNELLRLGYQRDQSADKPGSFAVGRDTIIFTTREFQFFDGLQQSRRFRVSFNRGMINDIQDRETGFAETLVRLEPPLVGSLFPGHGEDRVIVTPDRVPLALINALTAVEDRKFFSHWGLDPKGILRAAWANLSAGRIEQGGSTLTQQLVKSYYLTGERTFWRKFNEAIMAMLLELRFSKEELLTAYTNEVFLGQDGHRAIHGFGLASHFYFNKPLNELPVEQLALLAGMVKGPSLYDPRKYPERATQRRDLVLAQMHEQGYLDANALDEYQSRDLGLVSGKSESSYYPAFLGLVKQQLRHEYDEKDLTQKGLRVFTNFDPVVQNSAQQALEAFVAQRGDADLQGAMVVTSVDGAEVLAVVGGKDRGFNGFNRALQASRPIGSLVKPAVYLAAFDSGRHSLVSTVVDEPINVRQEGQEDWVPENFDGEYYGDISLLRAIAESRNIPTVRVGLDIGLDNVVQTLKQLGVSKTAPTYPSLLLGALDLTPLEVAQMYNTLANGGFLTPLKSVRSVTDSTGEPLGRYPLTVKKTVSNNSLHQVQQALVAAMVRGTGQSVSGRFPPDTTVAGKTGTTNDLRDSWFAGFSGNYVAVVWLGHDDNTPIGLSGSTGALPVWTNLMEDLGNQGLLLDAPEGFLPGWIDYPSGLGSREGCGDAWPVSLPMTVELESMPGCGKRGRFGKRALRWFQRVFGG